MDTCQVHYFCIFFASANCFTTPLSFRKAVAVSILGRFATLYFASLAMTLHKTLLISLFPANLEKDWKQ